MADLNAEIPCALTVSLLTYNAGPLLRRVLDAVFAQETTRPFEVLVVDSASTDGTQDLVRKYPVRLISIAREDFDFGRTRDLAFEQARGSIVVTLSQDAVPLNPQWLDHLVQPLDDPDVGAACGLSMPDPERGFPQFPWERNGYFYFTREIRKFTARYGKGLSFANAAVRRSAWERLRIEAQPVGEDFQFQQKLHAAGLKIAFPEDAPVLHHHTYTLASLWRRCRNEGLGLRALGCPYTEIDLARDLASWPKYIQWLREIKRGSLRTSADFAFPVVRPVAVYVGSRFARQAKWK
jgi:rhamnosyltransferase